MRFIPYLFLVFLTFNACNSNKSKADTTPKNSNSTASLTEEKIELEALEWEEPPMLLGEFQIEELQKEPYNEWYTPIYEETVIDEERVAYLGTLLDDIEIIGYVGSWCSDTQIELPNLIKILEQLDFDSSKLKLIGTDEMYQAPDGSNKEWHIENVPTFIFLKDKKELGRFIEFPDVSLLEDIIKILENK